MGEDQLKCVRDYSSVEWLGQYGNCRGSSVGFSCDFMCKLLEVHYVDGCKCDGMVVTDDFLISDSISLSYSYF